MDEEIVNLAILETSSLNPEIIQYYIEKQFERSIELSFIKGVIINLEINSL